MLGAGDGFLKISSNVLAKQQVQFFKDQSYQMLPNQDRK
jgi:hypothetical protein